MIHWCSTAWQLGPSVLFFLSMSIAENIPETRKLEEGNNSLAKRSYQRHLAIHRLAKAVLSFQHLRGHTRWLPQLHISSHTHLKPDWNQSTTLLHYCSAMFGIAVQLGYKMMKRESNGLISTLVTSLESLSLCYWCQYMEFTKRVSTTAV